MDIYFLVGYLGAVLTGFVLGVLGGGGAIISLPILIYLFHISPMEASSYSLILVAVTALIGSFKNMQNKMVNWESFAFCGIPAVFAIFITRKFILKSIPSILFTIHGFPIHKEKILLILLALVILMVAKNMWMPKSDEIQTTENHFLVLGKSLLAGLFIGLVGIGGGFLLTPLILSHKQMKFQMATATSLALISLNSTIGFLSDLSNSPSLDYTLLISLTVLAVLGMILGLSLVQKMNSILLKKIFGIILFSLGLFMLVKETGFI